MMQKRSDTVKTRRRSKGQEGVVLLMVLLLVIMFTGLGLLAMQHTQGELRSAASYMDATSATELAETAVMLAATDMKQNWRNQQSPCGDYATTFLQAKAANQKDHIHPPFSARYMSPDAGCADGVPQMPLPELRGAAPLYQTPILGSALANVTLDYRAPEAANPPPGFSTDVSNLTYCWRNVTVESNAVYGPLAVPNQDIVSKGRATVMSLMRIGPVEDFQCE